MRTLLFALLVMLALPLHAATADSPDLAQLQKHAERGDAVAQNNLAVRYATGDGVTRDHEKAAHWYRQAAEQGHAIAQHNLGALYELGLGVPEDLDAAAVWYRMAAEQGDGWAQFSLARLYTLPEFDGRDPVKAYTWALLAVRMPDPELQKNCARFLRDLGARLSREQIAKATSMAGAWRPRRF